MAVRYENPAVLCKLSEKVNYPYSGIERTLVEEFLKHPSTVKIDQAKRLMVLRIPKTKLGEEEKFITKWIEEGVALYSCVHEMKYAVQFLITFDDSNENGSLLFRGYPIESTHNDQNEIILTFDGFAEIGFLADALHEKINEDKNTPWYDKEYRDDLCWGMMKGANK